MKPCDNPPSPGFRTCDIPGHRAYEQKRLVRGKALFRLKERLLGIATASAMRSIGSDDAVLELLDDEEISAELELLVQSKPSKKNPPEKSPSFKSALTRRWTFNEQLIVRPCGVILSRATFFEAEGPANALVSTPGLSPPDTTAHTTY